jgi:hypothetical protein
MTTARQANGPSTTEVTSRQSEMAFKLCFRKRDRSAATRAALCHYIEAMRVFEPALETYREELRKRMDMFCPRAAKRIREGRPGEPESDWARRSRP